MKKNLNSFHRVRGRKDQGVYLALEMVLGGYLVLGRGCLGAATCMVRVVAAEDSESGEDEAIAAGVVVKGRKRVIPFRRVRESPGLNDSIPVLSVAGRRPSCSSP